MIKKQDNKKNNIYLIFLFIILLFLIYLLFKDNITKKEDTFILLGTDITLKYNEDYVEEGCKYIDKNNNDLSSFVKISNNINKVSPGNYKVKYEYNDKVLIRNVVVLEPSSYDIDIKYTIDNMNITNNNVTISYDISGETYLKSELPDGNIIYDRKGSFLVSKNGVYKIKAYSHQNKLFEKDITINNIDTISPQGTCTATLNTNNTTITTNIYDNNKIVKYEYYDNGNFIENVISKSFTTTNKTSKNIMVKAFDEASNYVSVECEIIDKSYYEPILPLSSEKIIFKEETETLKAYITHQDGYYLTRIWTKNAYNQLNKAISNDYGKKLYLPIDLLKMSMNETNLTNKLIIGFNASGFYLKDTYDAFSVSKYPLYNMTEVGTIVINNGALFRNVYDKAYKDWIIMGINKENKMVLFDDKKTNTKAEIEYKKNWSEEVINSGIRNTFNFAGPVIINGQKVNEFSKSMPDYTNKVVKKIQLICQVNENNFILFTSNNVTREKAIDVYLSLGCQTATNLDGGGSIALLYKSKNSNEFKTIIGGGRPLPETGYFTE